MRDEILGTLTWQPVASLQQNGMRELITVNAKVCARNRVTQVQWCFYHVRILAWQMIWVSRFEVQVSALMGPRKNAHM